MGSPALPKVNPALSAGVSAYSNTKVRAFSALKNFSSFIFGLFSTLIIKALFGPKRAFPIPS